MFLTHKDNSTEWVKKRWQLALKSTIFHAMSWKYGFNIIRGCVIWIRNHIHGISIEMSQNHDRLKMASAIFYKPPIAANELIAIYIMAIISGFFPARGPEGLFF